LALASCAVLRLPVSFSRPSRNFAIGACVVPSSSVQLVGSTPEKNGLAPATLPSL
jgi:hypothetical protein